MTDHTPLPVKGYVAQSDDRIALANEGKELEERYLRWLDKLATLNSPPALDHQDAMIDGRCLALARSNIEQGAMWAIRSIFKPQRVKLPEDATR